MPLLLQEEQNTENQAAQVRVTPEEFVQATAAIEARQNARAQQEAATIPIGEAVQQLHLEATPEEVLAEVQAQRARTQTGSRQTRRAVSMKTLKTVVAVQFALLALLTGMLANSRWWLTRVKSQLAFQDARVRELQTTNPDRLGFVPASGRPLNVQLLDTDKFRSLDVPVGQTIRCKYDTIETLTGNVDFSHLYTATHPTGTTWELIRENDGFHVKCWAKVEDAQRLLNGQSGTVYATKAGAFDEHPEMQIKVPVEAFKNGFVHITTDSPVSIVLNGAH